MGIIGIGLHAFARNALRLREMGNAETVAIARRNTEVLADAKEILGVEGSVHRTTDADGTYPSESIPDLLGKLEAADMAIGARNGHHVHIPWARRPARWLLRWLAAQIAGR